MLMADEMSRCFRLIRRQADGGRTLRLALGVRFRHFDISTFIPCDSHIALDWTSLREWKGTRLFATKAAVLYRFGF